MVPCPKIQRGTLLKGGDISTHNFPKKTVKERKLVDDQLNLFSVTQYLKLRVFFLEYCIFRKIHMVHICISLCEVLPQQRMIYIFRCLT